MPEVDGSYLLTLDVPGGDGSTNATVLVTHVATGTTESPAVTADSVTAYSAVLDAIADIGWYVATWTVTGAGANVKSMRFYVTDTPTGFGVWPPSLLDLRLDRGDRDDQDDTNDDKMSMCLDAAIAHVRDVKRSSYDVAAVEQSGVVLPAPTANIILGTIRLAARLAARRASFDNLVAMGDQGASIIPSYDSDIERLLQVGRFTKPAQAFA